MDDNLIITVSQLNGYLKSLVESASPLKDVYIRGEISNFVRYYKTGHIYMSIKDAFSSVRVVIFSRYAAGIKFEPENGMNVIVFGKVTVYEKDGTCQIQGFDLQPDGVGAEFLRLEQLKNKLAEEGLFDESIKKPLPKFPRKIGVITSRSGAAISDIKNTVANRFPIAKLIFAPVTVQGETAAPTITAAVKKFGKMKDIDVLIIARGGGSTEDLSAFNDEMLVRTVFACRIPVISAVGHEVDTTLIDLAADVRASTPTYGAMLATPDREEILSQLAGVGKKLGVVIRHRLKDANSAIDAIKTKPCLTSAGYYVEKNSYILSELCGRLFHSTVKKIDRSQQKLAQYAGSLDAMSPLKVLGRGYSIVFHRGKVVSDAGMVTEGDSIDIRMKDSGISAVVSHVEPGTEQEER